MNKEESKRLQQLIDKAFELTKCGLSHAAFDAADADTLKAAITLIQKGVPVPKIVNTMNLNPRAGKAQLAKMCADMETKAAKETNRLEAYWKKCKSPIKVLTDAQVAALLSRLSMSAVLAELHATLLTETDKDKLRLVFLEVLRLHHALGKNPNREGVKDASISSLDEAELKDIYLAVAAIGYAIRQRVGEKVLESWVRRG